MPQPSATTARRPVKRLAPLSEDAAELGLYSVAGPAYERKGPNNSTITARITLPFVSYIHEDVS